MGYSKKPKLISSKFTGKVYNNRAKPDKTISNKKENYLVTPRFPKQPYTIDYTILNRFKMKYLSSLDLSYFRGQPCFIIGAGPSMIDFDYSLLKDKLTIGVNKVFTKYYCTINYSMDARFHDYYNYDIVNHPEDKKDMLLWQNYTGIKACIDLANKNFYFAPDVYVIKCLMKRYISLNIEEGIFKGDNSGFGAMMLAISLGSNPIYLLGIDCKTTKGNPRQYSRYLWDTKDNDKLNGHMQRNVTKFKGNFERFAPSLKKAGIEVINLGPDSALECFPKQDYKSILCK